MLPLRWLSDATEGTNSKYATQNRINLTHGMRSIILALANHIGPLTL